MFNGTLKGKIVMKKSFEGKDAVHVCAVAAVLVNNYAFGKVQAQMVECWLPDYLVSKRDFLMKPDLKYVLISFDHITTASDNLYEGHPAKFAVTISNVYRG